MIIIGGYSLTEVADRDAAVAAFQSMVERTRREGGCIDLISAPTRSMRSGSVLPSSRCGPQEVVTIENNLSVRFGK